MKKLNRPLTDEEQREQERIFKEIGLIASDGITERRARRVQAGRIGRYKRKSAARMKVKR